MTRFANPKAAQAMMQTHGHTNLGMPPKPGFPGTGAPPKPGAKPTITGAPPFNPNDPRAAALPRVVELAKIRAALGKKPGMTGPAGMNPQMAQKLGGIGAALGKKLGMKKGGAVSSASKRADGIATKGKTKGKIV